MGKKRDLYVGRSREVDAFPERQAPVITRGVFHDAQAYRIQMPSRGEMIR
jgi:hypothetical protein